MKNTLLDTNLGDVTSINLPIGQSTPYAGAFTSISVSQVAASSISVQSVAGVQESWAPAIAVVATTSTLAAAVALTAANNVVAGSYTATVPVALPTVASWLGGVISVFNQTTMTVGVWPQANDIIDVKVTGTVVLLNPGLRCNFYAVTATTIISAQLGVTSV
ncbi:MAG: hypothetical protein ACLP3R_11175 [Candidatus Korobacteraceae bacterium]